MFVEFAENAKVQELRGQLEAFMDEHVHPAEPRFAAEVAALEARGSWDTPPVVEELKAEARSRGLWNLFLPEERFGAGLSNLEYAPLA